MANKQEKTITFSYDWDGGNKTVTVGGSDVDLSYIAPENSPGIFGVDFRGVNFGWSSLAYSLFSECDFRGARLAEVEFTEAEFPGCDFRGAVISDELREQVRKTGGITTDDEALLHKDLKAFKELYKYEMAQAVRAVREKYTEILTKIDATSGKKCETEYIELVRGQHDIYEVDGYPLLEFPGGNSVNDPSIFGRPRRKKRLEHSS